jgi:hypothetical protein
MTFDGRYQKTPMTWVLDLHKRHITAYTRAAVEA